MAVQNYFFGMMWFNAASAMQAGNISARINNSTIDSEGVSKLAGLAAIHNQISIYWNIERHYHLCRNARLDNGKKAVLPIQKSPGRRYGDTLVCQFPLSAPQIIGILINRLFANSAIARVALQKFRRKIRCNCHD